MATRRSFGTGTHRWIIPIGPPFILETTISPKDGSSTWGENRIWISMEEAEHQIFLRRIRGSLPTFNLVFTELLELEICAVIVKHPPFQFFICGIVEHKKKIFGALPRWYRYKLKVMNQ